MSHKSISWAVHNGRVDSLKLLLSFCGSTTWDDPIGNGHGIVHYAARLGNDEIFRTLLFDGPEVLRSLANNLGETPLHTVAEVGTLAAASMLLEVGCGIDH